MYEMDELIDVTNVSMMLYCRLKVINSQFEE
jgi:hypothetical protein